MIYGGYSVSTIFFIFFGGSTISDLMINEQIRDKEVRVIGSDGEQLGIMSAREAQKLADDEGLDLVKISPKANPPVCKIVDYGKFRYEQARKEKEAKKNAPAPQAEAAPAPATEAAPAAEEAQA